MTRSRIDILVPAALALVVSAPALAQMGGGPSEGRGARSDDMPEMRERSEEIREAGERKAKKSRVEADASLSNDSASEISRDKSVSGPEHAATQGSEKAQEMRNRRDERKAIMDDYKSNKNARKEVQKGERKARPELDAETSTRMDADSDDAGDELKKAKKPWWKFWGE